MTLASVLEKADYEKLADGLKTAGIYVEKDGKYILDADVESHPGVAGLRSTVTNTRQERERLEAELKRFKEVGDPEKAKEALAKIQQLETDRAKAEGNFVALETQLKNKHKEEQDTLKAELATANSDIQALVVTNRVLETLGLEDVKGNSKILLPHILKRVRAEKVNGEWVPVVLDANGNKAFGDGQGTPMTIKQLVLDMKKDPDFAPNFASTQRSGSGMPPGAGGAAGGGAGSGGGSGKKTMKKSELSGPLSKETVDKIAKGEIEVTD